MTLRRAWPVIAVLLALAPVYIENYGLKQYARSLASQPDSAVLPDAVLQGRILTRARELKLPVQTDDVRVIRNGGNPHVEIGKYKIQVFHIDLHFPESSFRLATSR